MKDEADAPPRSPATLLLAEAVEMHDFGADANPVPFYCRRFAFSRTRRWRRRQFRARLGDALLRHLLGFGDEVRHGRRHMLAGDVVGGALLAELQAELRRGVIEGLDRLK